MRVALQCSFYIVLSVTDVRNELEVWKQFREELSQLRPLVFLFRSYSETVSLPVEPSRPQFEVERESEGERPDATHRHRREDVVTAVVDVALDVIVNFEEQQPYLVDAERVPDNMPLLFDGEFELRICHVPSVEAHQQLDVAQIQHLVALLDFELVSAAVSVLLRREDSREVLEFFVVEVLEGDIMFFRRVVDEVLDECELLLAL